MQERENDLEKQRIAEQQKKEMQLQIQFIEQVLINMIKLGKFDEAIQKYEQFPHKTYINQSITNQLNEHKRVQEDQDKEIHTLKQDAELIDSIIIAERKGDLDLALNRYKRLNNKNDANLTFNLKTKLENHDADLKQQRGSEEQQKIAKAEAKTARAKRKKMIFSLSILAILGLCVTSFFLKLPSSVWDGDSDGIYNWSDACPDSSGTIALNAPMILQKCAKVVQTKMRMVFLIQKIPAN
jgi:tetratricopeptide (TPR) repeat protein